MINDIVAVKWRASVHATRKYFKRKEKNGEKIEIETGHTRNGDSLSLSLFFFSFFFIFSSFIVECRTRDIEKRRRERPVATIVSSVFLSHCKTHKKINNTECRNQCGICNKQKKKCIFSLPLRGVCSSLHLIWNENLNIILLYKITV